MRLIEVECDTLDQVTEARELGVDVVLVDNMSPEDVRKRAQEAGLKPEDLQLPVQPPMERLQAKACVVYALG
jgi:nicotinate-nucleotide pyrophosphorylase